jgi:ribonucleotide monophosphatase NagD (HAD superfamily)
MVRAALDRLRLPADACLMVGDRMETDILMGQQAGMATVLVLTGVTQREDLDHAPVQPDYVLESIAELPRLFDSGPKT